MKESKMYYFKLLINVSNRIKYETNKKISLFARILNFRLISQSTIIMRIGQLKLFLIAFFAAILLCYMGATTLISELTYYEYSYKGEVLGVVKTQSAVLDRVEVIERKVGEDADVIVDINQPENIELKPVFRLVVDLNVEQEVDQVQVAEEKIVEAAAKQLDLYQLVVSDKAIGLFESAEACNTIVASAKAILLGQPEETFISVEIVEAIKIVPTTTTIENLSDKDEAMKQLTDTNAKVFNLLTKQHLTFREAIPFQIEYRDTNDLYAGEEQVIVEGINGEAEITADLTKQGGEEIDRQEYENIRLSEPTNKVIRRGARERGVLKPGYIIRPISGRYSSGFGYRWGRMHTGIDYSAPQGTSVRAADSGVVTSVGWNGAYGKEIIVNHGGFITRYAHLSTYKVSVGDRVHRGDVIAGSGNTGNSTGPHLHFEVIVGGTALNPALYY
jgi:murein DD-endopeptidase MepM/ murein hydrolase activator NlpD